MKRRPQATFLSSYMSVPCWMGAPSIADEVAERGAKCLREFFGAEQERVQQPG